jgi:hypothetical protein
VALVGVQALVLVAAAAYLLIGTVAGSPDQPDAAVTLGVLAAAVGVLLGWLARSLYGLRLWARTPVVFLEILFLPVAWTLVNSGQPVAGLAYFALSLAVLVLLFTPPARQALESATSPR